MLRENSILARTILALWLLAIGPALGQEKDCAASEPSTSCTLKEIYEAARQEALKVEAAPVVARAEEASREVTRDLNMTMSAPDSFASDLHASIQNFINRFDFAISDVEESEDGQALIVRMNPLQRGRDHLGVTLTVTKPTVSGSVEKAIPEDIRAATVERLEALQEDLDDLTLSLSYSRSTKQCQLEQIQDGRCWGRRVETYKSLLAYAVEGAAIRRVEGTDPFEMQSALVSSVVGAGLQPTDNVLDLELGAIAEEKRMNVVSQVRHLGEKNGEETDAAQMFFTEAGFKNLGSLVDNQPQLAATVS